MRRMLMALFVVLFLEISFLFIPQTHRASKPRDGTPLIANKKRPVSGAFLNEVFWKRGLGENLFFKKGFPPIL
jgi:hypothetical protein